MRTFFKKTDVHDRTYVRRVRAVQLDSHMVFSKVLVKYEALRCEWDDEFRRRLQGY